MAKKDNPEKLEIPVERNTAVEPNYEMQVHELKKIVESYAQREKLMQQQMIDVQKECDFKLQYALDCVKHCATSIQLVLNKPMEK